MMISSWPLLPTWPDVAVRLALTVVSSALLGFNRGSHGHPAGVRTTILVGLAGAVAMIQANILLSSSGKTGDSFGVLDLMRMPLGILTGVGFIGGGVILKRGGTVTGLTTAATLWIVTVISLCFGGGQIGVGLAGTAVAMIALYPLKALDLHIPRLQRGTLQIITEACTEPPDLNPIVQAHGCRARFVRQLHEPEARRTSVWFDIRWTQAAAHTSTPSFLTAVAAIHQIASFAMQSESDD